MNPEPNVNYGCIYPIISMVNKIKNKSIRTAVVSMALAITSIASTLLMGLCLTVNILGFIALNVLSVIIILASLKVAMAHADSNIDGISTVVVGAVSYTHLTLPTNREV